MAMYRAEHAPAIQITNVVQRFGTFTAINGVSLEAPRGSIFALLGPNGAGKTTLIKTLTTLLPPSSGTLKIQGLDIYGNPNEARKRFGVVFQGPSLDEQMSPLEHMELHGAFFAIPRSIVRERTEELLSLFNLWEKRRDRVKHLSGGQRRRLEIARVFVHDPAVLFLDEPTVGLDAQSRRQLWDHIHHLREIRPLTVFLTTHYLEEVEQAATHVAVLDYGNIVAQGSPTSLMAAAETATLEAAFLALIDRRKGLHDVNDLTIKATA
jgi:ABC-2 type transport system ATP-binding protein